MFEDITLLQLTEWLDHKNQSVITFDMTLVASPHLMF